MFKAIWFEIKLGFNAAIPPNTQSILHLHSVKLLRSTETSRIFSGWGFSDQKNTRKLLAELDEFDT